MRASYLLLVTLATTATAFPSLSRRAGGLGGLAGRSPPWEYCLEDIAPIQGCAPLDDECVCGNQVILKSFNDCIVNDCGLSQVENADTILENVCDSDGITITLSDPLANSWPAPTGVVSK